MIRTPKLREAGKYPVYLDCNATTPIEPEVLALVSHCFQLEYGNAGSRTHEYGLRAKKLVQLAREQIAAVARARSEEVIFTSGATEANNLAIFGLEGHGSRTARRHIISTAIEHKAILEPLEALAKRGFEVSLLQADSSGAVSARELQDLLRPETLLVSVMQVNNETGVIQPIAQLCEALSAHDAYFHVDAAQGFGKELAALQLPRVDLISASSHKIGGPVGVGALIARRRGFAKPPLEPLILGGGQELGLRPGTLPVPLLAGFGLAAELAEKTHPVRRARCSAIRQDALSALKPLNIRINGDPAKSVPHVLNFSVDGLDSEAAILALKDLAAVSNGSACTSQHYRPSHVLKAMDLSEAQVAGAVRLSWCHRTPDVDWSGIAERLQVLSN